MIKRKSIRIEKERKILNIIETKTKDGKLGKNLLKKSNLTEEGTAETKKGKSTLKKK